MKMEAISFGWLRLLEYLATYTLKISVLNFYRPRTYVRREVMFSQVCVCSGGGGTRSQIFGGGGT